MTITNKNWRREAGTGYYGTVDETGAYDMRYYIVPGKFEHPATLFTYRFGPAGFHGTVEECMAEVARRDCTAAS